MGNKVGGWDLGGGAGSEEEEGGEEEEEEEGEEEDFVWSRGCERVVGDVGGC